MRSTTSAACQTTRIPDHPAAADTISGLALVNTEDPVHIAVSRYARQSWSAAGSSPRRGHDEADGQRREPLLDGDSPLGFLRLCQNSVTTYINDAAGTIIATVRSRRR